MFEIGNSLREARDRRQIELPQAEQATKIRGKYLRALEDEQFDALPSQTYVKGFLRTYADYLGLDGQLYVDEFNSRFVVGERTSQPGVRERPRASPAAPTGERLETLVVLVGIGRHRDRDRCVQVRRRRRDRTSSRPRERAGAAGRRDSRRRRVVRVRPGLPLIAAVDGASLRRRPPRELAAGRGRLPGHDRRAGHSRAVHGQALLGHGQHPGEPAASGAAARRVRVPAATPGHAHA